MASGRREDTGKAHACHMEHGIRVTTELDRCDLEEKERETGKI